MNLKTLVVTALTVLVTTYGCDAPRDGGASSAGNNQPDGGKREQCLAPRQINIDPVSYVLADGLTYTASAYLMDGECDIIDINGEHLLKVTLVAIDSRGSRMNPQLNNSPQESPFGATILFALPTRFSLELVATGNMSRDQVKDSGTIFVGCALVPVGKGKGPVDVQLSDIGGGKGKVSCRVAG